MNRPPRVMGSPRRLMIAILSLVCLCSGSAGAQGNPVPADLEIHIEAGSVGPSHDLHIFDLDANGNGTFCLVPPANRETGTCSTVTQHQLSSDQVSAVYDAVVAGNFFGLATVHRSRDLDGTLAEMTITARGATHEVATQNVALPAFDDIVLAINAALPEDSKIIYNAIFDKI